MAGPSFTDLAELFQSLDDSLEIAGQYTNFTTAAVANFEAGTAWVIENHKATFFQNFVKFVPTGTGFGTLQDFTVTIPKEGPPGKWKAVSETVQLPGIFVDLTKSTRDERLLGLIEIVARLLGKHFGYHVQAVQEVPDLNTFQSKGIVKAEGALIQTAAAMHLVLDACILKHCQLKISEAKDAAVANPSPAAFAEIPLALLPPGPSAFKTLDWRYFFGLFDQSHLASFGALSAAEKLQFVPKLRYFPTNKFEFANGKSWPIGEPKYVDIFAVSKANPNKDLRTLSHFVDEVGIAASIMLFDSITLWYDAAISAVSQLAEQVSKLGPKNVDFDVKQKKLSRLKLVAALLKPDFAKGYETGSHNWNAALLATMASFSPLGVPNSALGDLQGIGQWPENTLMVLVAKNYAVSQDPGPAGHFFRETGIQKSDGTLNSLAALWREWWQWLTQWWCVTVRPESKSSPIIFETPSGPLSMAANSLVAAADIAEQAATFKQKGVSPFESAAFLGIDPIATSRTYFNAVKDFGPVAGKAYAAGLAALCWGRLMCYERFSRVVATDTTADTPSEAPPIGFFFGDWPFAQIVAKPPLGKKINPLIQSPQIAPQVIFPWWTLDVGSDKWPADALDFLFFETPIRIIGPQPGTGHSVKTEVSGYAKFSGFLGWLGPQADLADEGLGGMLADLVAPYVKFELEKAIKIVGAYPESLGDYLTSLCPKLDLRILIVAVLCLLRRDSNASSFLIQFYDKEFGGLTKFPNVTEVQFVDA